ncbi:hypothetical protein [Vibrio phage CKB-S2]|nr:hypothetical protein [Vibrio phage CKB-S2]
MGFLSGIGAGFKKLLGLEPVVESATKIIDKIAGTDWTPKEKAQWVLDYQNATKHQSLPRRLIAISVAFVWLLCVLIWLVCTIWLNLAGAGDVPSGELVPTAANAAIGIQADVERFMAEQVDKPFNLILSFYFLTQLVKR